MALWRLVLSTRVPECQKTKKGGLDQYDPERFGRLVFATIRKNVGMKGLRSSGPTGTRSGARPFIITERLAIAEMTFKVAVICTGTIW